jgi:hypothetical protein
MAAFLAPVVAALGGWGGVAMAGAGVASLGVQLWQGHKTGQMAEEGKAKQEEMNKANADMAARMAADQQRAQAAIIAQFAASTGLSVNLGGPTGMPQMAHGMNYPGFMPNYGQPQG